MIVVTVGTNEAPFDRLLRAIDDLPGDEEILVQYGSSQLRPVAAAKCVDYLPFDDLLALVRRARVVVTHAGVGSIFLALSQGTRPVVMPRLRRFEEAVDDHQLPFARRLAERGLVTLLENESQLAATVGREQNVARIVSPAPGELAQDLAAFLRSLIDHRQDVASGPSGRYSR